MRIFLAGATGVVGRRLVPELIAGGHEVVAMTRTPAKADDLRAAGALPVVADALDRDAVLGAVVGAQPEVVVHQLTALDGITSLRNFDAAFAQTNRLRTEGLAHLLEGARAAGTRRVIAASYTGWPLAPTGGPVKDEDAPFDPAPPKAMRESLAAIRALETATMSADGIEGVVLRYSAFYGPGTTLGADGEMVQLVRRRKLPIVGGGTGVWSFTHVDDAAGAVVAALPAGAPTGIFAIVDDEPAPVAEWLPALAEAVGAPRPPRVPVWVGRLAAGEAVARLMTRARGASNAKARRELRWVPRHRTWREGFAAAL